MTGYSWGADATNAVYKRRLEKQKPIVPAPQPAPAPVAPAGPDVAGLQKLQEQQAASRAASDAKSAALDTQSAGLFNQLRQRAQQQGNAAKQTNNEALRRRFASVGNLNSGAAIKAQTLADQEADKATNQAVQDVDLQEQQQKLQTGEAEKGRLFQRDLADSQQNFQNFWQSDASKMQWANLNREMNNDKLNALTAIDNLSNNALEAGSGVKNSGGFLGIGSYGIPQGMQALLKKLGYA